MSFQKLSKVIVFLFTVHSVSGACIDGYQEWVPGKCFKYHQSEVDYPTSKKTCAEEMTMMLSIHSVNQSDELDQYVTTPYGHFWLGLECDSSSGNYLYTDGSETSLSSQWVVHPCVPQVGYHHHTGGRENMFVQYSWFANMTGYASANTLCYHFIDNPPSSDAPATYPQEMTTPFNPWTDGTSVGPSFSPGNSCGDCVISDVWLDIMFIVDSSESMQQQGVYDVQATIQTILHDIRVTRSDSVRAGIIVYSDKAQTVYGLGSINSDSMADNANVPYIKGYGTNMEAAIITAFDGFSENSRSLNARKVIVIFASAYRNGDYQSPEVIARAFRDEGGVIITVDYSAWGDLGPIPMLDKIASPGYAIAYNDEIVEQLRGAFCDANCYCPQGSKAFTYGFTDSCQGRCLPTGGCFAAVTLPAAQPRARNDCKNKGGDLMSIHSSDQQWFATAMFASKIQFWTGLSFSNNYNYQWTDGTPFDYNVASYSNNGKCYYSWQYSGFSTRWDPDDCNVDRQYACEFTPCAARQRQCTKV